ncbi:DUF6301 family protein [Actinobaculum sp. 313]|uniref:DUF6301 family protein n=1 Tax=Actinobaculum sp. 313 TaxID=2495645 RepID=UPI001F0C1805|nr:DUF6301 family protein [Actinobaculum sp. 313]
MSQTPAAHDSKFMQMPLPDGTLYRIVPIPVGIRVIRLWLEHDWPLSTDHALQLRDELGWVSSPSKATLFTTNHGTGEKDASAIAIRGMVDSFAFNLSSRIALEFEPLVEAVARSAFDQYVGALSAFYGKGITEWNDEGEARSVTWQLPSTATVQIGKSGWLLRVNIDSPNAVAAAAAEAEYFEIFDENDDELPEDEW